MRNTTHCYLRNKSGSHTLMLHRTKKANDENAGKWIGIGGGIEEGESPEEGMIREIYEECGLTPLEMKLHGVVTFVSDEFGTEYLFLYTAVAEADISVVPGCDEGELRWVETDKVPFLPTWEGDAVFMKLIADDAPFFSLKLVYEGDRLVSKVLNGKKM